MMSKIRDPRLLHRMKTGLEHKKHIHISRRLAMIREREESRRGLADPSLK